MRKAIIKIFNLIFLALTAVSLTAFATKDFVALDLTYPLTADFVAEKLDGKFGDQITREDLEEAFKDGVDAKINIGIPAKSLFDSFNNETAVSEGIKKSIDTTVDNLVDALNGPLNTLVERVAKNTAKQQATQSIKDQIKNNLPEETKDKADEIFNNRVKDEDIDNLTNELYDTMLSGEATVDGLVNDMADDINKILKGIEAGEAEDPTGFKYNEFDPNSEQGAEIKDSLTDALNQFGLIDSEGKISDADTAMAVIINKLLEDPEALGGKSEKFDREITREDILPEIKFVNTPLKVDLDKTRKLEIERNSAVDPDAPVEYTISNVEPEGSITLDGNVVTGVAEGTATITAKCDGLEIHEEISCKRLKSLKETLREFVGGLIDGTGIYDTIDSVGKFVVYGLIAMMAPWALFALITVLRLIRRKKCWTKPWVVFTFAFYQIIIGVLLTMALTTFKGAILGALGGVEMISSYIEILEAIDISLKFSCFIPSIIYLVFIPLTIVYMIVCHGYKKQLKEEKRARKAAKRAA